MHRKAVQVTPMFTETVTYSVARDRLASLMDAVEATRDVVVITRRGHTNVALIAEDELSGLLETAHLLRSPANARRLLESLVRSRAGKGEKMTLDELTEKSGAAQTER
jgi:antitoxin YefM